MAGALPAWPSRMPGKCRVQGYFNMENQCTCTRVCRDYTVNAENVGLLFLNEIMHDNCHNADINTGTL